MASLTVFKGIVTLPTALMVAPDALGERFDVELEQVNLRLTLPAVPSQDPTEAFQLISPTTDADIEQLIPERHGRNETNIWGYGGFDVVPGQPKRLESHVAALVLAAVAEEGVLANVAQGAWDVGSTFDAWWSNVLTWLEVWTPQHLIPDANAPLRSSGRLLDVRSDPPQRTGWGAGGLARVYASSHAITRAMLSSAMSRAATDHLPPLQWRLYCRASRMRDHRQALLSAAAAAEVALAEVVHARLVDASEEARERIIQNARGIVGLVQLVEDLDNVPAANSRRRRIMDRVAGPRNDAAHRGLSPSQDTVRDALKEVSTLLAAYTPAPPPN